MPNIINTRYGKTDRIIAEVPSFGSQYTWRAVFDFGKPGKTKSAFFHFSTGTIPEADTTVRRLRIINPAFEYKDDYVFLDDNKTLYDMNGNPVWYLPRIEGINMTPRDIKVSPQGTITFLYDPPCEVNYNGDVLWKPSKANTVSGDYSEHFHHEFTRLNNGHYMALGQDSALWEHSMSAPNENNTPLRKTQFGTIIEYDEKGNVTWSWKSSDYFIASGLQYYNQPGNKQNIDVHENAFYFDEKNNNIYVSFKNINRVLKVKYPEGTVTAAYGDTPGVPETGNGLFCGQHACKLSEQGYLYLFNNNSCDPVAYPKVVMMEEPHHKNEGLKKIWEYECTGADTNNKVKINNDFISGGNVQELPDHSILVCMSGIYSKIFIVSPYKKVLWAGVPESWNAAANRWDCVSQYRASIISAKELEHLIWNSAPHAPAREADRILTSH